MSAHPSYLELDRFFLGRGAETTDAHVSECEHCQAHLARLREALSVPSSVRQLACEQRSSWRALLRAPQLVGLGAAAAIATVLVVWAPGRGGQGDLGAKGSPSVAVYVKRGDAVSLWDGREPLAPGDRLQLEVTADGMRYVAIAFRSLSGPWQPLYRGEVVGKDTRVPESWRLDDAPGPETLGVAVTAKPLSDAELSRVLERGARDREIWTTLLVLPKATAAGKQ